MAKWRAGLRSKIILWVLVPTALVLGTVSVLAYGTAQRGTEALVFARSEDRARLLASQLSGELTTYRQTLGAVAAQAVPAGDGTMGEGVPSGVLEVLDAWPLGSLEVFDAGVLVLDRDGTVPAATIGLESLVGRMHPSLRDVVDWTPDFVAGDDLGYSSVLREVVPDLTVVALPYVLPAEEPAAARAVVGLFRVEQQAVRTSRLYGRMWELYIGRMMTAAGVPGTPATPTGTQLFPQPETAYLVDGQGTVIFHPDTFMIGLDLSGRQVVQDALDGRRGPQRTENVQGQPVVTAAARVPRTAWWLISETSWAAVTGGARATTRLMLLLLALGVLVPVGIVTFAAGRITRPLARLTAGARSVAGGDFDQTIEVHTGDELETLAAQFNTMSAALQASYATLEQRVVDRTRELATLNAVSAAVSRSLDLAAVLTAALDETLGALGLGAGAAFRLADGRLRLLVHRGLSSGFVGAIEALMSGPSGVDTAGPAALEAVATQALVVRAVDAYPEGPLRDLLTAEAIDTVVSVPLVARGEALGVLNLVHRAGESAALASAALTLEMRSLLTSIGQQVGVAVENAALYANAESAAAAAERNRLARELHDAVSQTLFTANLIADTVPRLWERDPDEARRQLAALRRLTRGAQAEMRTLLLELRPAALLETELPKLLEHLTRAIAARADLEVTLMVAPVPLDDADMKLALYRLAQEALNNVAKHAGADHVAVLLRPEGVAGFCMEIRDDGCGFDIAAVPADHFGLVSMRERAAAIGATLTVESAAGEGTVVRVERTDGGRI